MSELIFYFYFINKNLIFNSSIQNSDFRYNYVHNGAGAPKLGTTVPPYLLHLDTPEGWEGRGAGLRSGGVAVSQLTAQDRHGRAQQGVRALLGRAEPPQSSGTRQVSVLSRSCPRDLEHRAVPALPRGPVPPLRHGPGSVLGGRRRRQAPLGGTVPPGPGLRPEQREDRLVPGRKAQRVR